VQRLTGEMRAADLASDVVVLRRVAHTLRGCLSNVGAKDLVRQLAILEEAAAASDAARAKALVPSIAARCEEAHHALAQAADTDRRAA
jgi:HPt (histidine-containing phosphotransfer) domain-containing protein